MIRQYADRQTLPNGTMHLRYLSWLASGENVELASRNSNRNEEKEGQEAIAIVDYYDYFWPW